MCSPDTVVFRPVPLRSPVEMFLAVAVFSGALYLVTGDQDLLVLKTYDKMQIVTVADFQSLAGDI